MDANSERWDADRLRALLREGEESGPPITTTREDWNKVWREANQEFVRRMIREGIESGPATEMTEADWERIRRKVREQLTRPQDQ